MTKPLTFYNKIIDKGSLKKLMSWAFNNYGSARASEMADELKTLGFRYATQAGVSISINDLEVPPVKKEMLAKTEAEIRETESRYARGEITEVERFQKVIDTWNSTSEALKSEVVKNFRETNPLNSVYMMAFSGARGNLSQVRQLVGMRGLMADPQGEIIDLPIKTNFREGLTVTEYIISSYGARKGLVDTALRTADSGYLTRRLVDVSQDVIIREVDCGTHRGLGISAMMDGDRVLIPLKDRLLGRVLNKDVVDSETGEVVYPRNSFITEDMANHIPTLVSEVHVRSPLTCEAARSVCEKCYGWSLAHSKPVNQGEAVGIIAAQSIGEPGTQLTMRTFHTGGVFTGEVAKQIKSKYDGIATYEQGLTARKVRTRHGDELQQVETGGKLVVTGENGKVQTISTQPGFVIYVQDGDKVTKGSLMIEESKLRPRSTERATKDVSSDLAGEILFERLSVEEKTDRQGNMTRISQRSGLLWVLSGDVYNLPPGSEPSVKNGDKVKEGDTLAETKLVSIQGGVVRFTEGREIEIITASVKLDQASVTTEHTGSQGEQYVIETAVGQRFSLKAAPGTKVQNHQVIAELIDDRYQTNTGGIVKYADIEIAKGTRKTGYEITKGGTLLWIPEESHEVNKDISLLIVEDGEYVEAGTELAKDIFSQSSGVVEVVQKNDILREIIIKPGKLHLTDEHELEDRLAEPGIEIIPGVIVEEFCYAEFVETTEGNGVLLRPVVEYPVSDEPIAPSQGSMNESGKNIELRSIQKIFYKDGERVKSVEGVSLINTQLVLEIEQQEGLHGNATINADIELTEDPEEEGVERLQLVILESLVLRRDTENDPLGGHTHSRILVKDGQEIEPGAVVATTEIQCKTPGEVRGLGGGAITRRILILRDEDMNTIEMPSDRTLEPGDLVITEQELAPGTVAHNSGQVISVNKKDKTAVLRIGRPYRVSSGAILHIDNGDLVQRGDNLVLLIFEREKTGDIIQGLPRIEELLEARRPKEACILSRRPGVCQVVYEDNEVIDIKVLEDDGTVTEYPLTIGQSALVSDGQRVGPGEPLTDGPPNPHEILEIFFEYHKEQEGVGTYEAALIGLEKAQTFLVQQVQAVYQSQGIDINDKHIEVIVRQMTNKVRIDDSGDTIMLPGELIELRQVEQNNSTMSITGGAPAEYTPLLLGITKASLNTDSFISAASFQETTRVLTEAAIEGKSDWLRGLKENVIIGRLIPAGTGYNSAEEAVQNSYQFDDNHNSRDRNELVNTSLIAEDENVILDDETARAYTSAQNLVYGNQKEEDILLDDKSAAQMEQVYDHGSSDSNGFGELDDVTDD